MRVIRRAGETLGATVVPILPAFAIAVLATTGTFFGYFTFCQSTYAGWDFKSNVGLGPVIAIAIGIAVFVVVLRWIVRRVND